MTSMTSSCMTRSCKSASLWTLALSSLEIVTYSPLTGNRQWSSSHNSSHPLVGNWGLPTNQIVRWSTLSSSAVYTVHTGRWGWTGQKQSSSLTLNSTSNQLIPALKQNQPLPSNPWRPGPFWGDKPKCFQTLQEVSIHIRPEFSAIDRFLLSVQSVLSTSLQPTCTVWASHSLALYLSLHHLQNGNNPPYLLHWW